MQTQVYAKHQDNSSGADVHAKSMPKVPPSLKLLDYFKEIHLGPCNYAL